MNSFKNVNRVKGMTKAFQNHASGFRMPWPNVYKYHNTQLLYHTFGSFYTTIINQCKCQVFLGNSFDCR